MFFPIAHITVEYYMEASLSDLTTCASRRLAAIRTNRFAPLQDTWAIAQLLLHDVADFVERSKRKHIEHKKAMEGVRRSKVVDVALENLLGIANGSMRPRKAVPKP